MLRALLCLFCLIPCLPCPARASSPPTLRMHVWVSYMPTWLLEEFTRETGIRVSVTFFADNRDLYRKLKEEGEMQRFDIVTPSAETVQQLAALPLAFVGDALADHSLDGEASLARVASGGEGFVFLAQEARLGEPPLGLGKHDVGRDQALVSVVVALE